MCDVPGHAHDQDHPHDHTHEHEAHGHDVAPPPGAGTFRVVISGKGGVGKTTITAILARLLARRLHRVLALDADPQMNLPYALGIPRAAARAIVPLSQNRAYVEEKTGVRSGAGYGVMFRLNPEVADAVERFGVVGPDGVNLVVMGTVVQPAAGCLCPENALLSSLATTLSIREGEVILMDTQAGVEHFGRALAKGFRHAIVVTDPSFNGVNVALHAARLAREMGMPAVHLVVNRVRAGSDLDRVRRIVEEEGGFEFSTEHALPVDKRLLDLEPDVGPLLSPPSSALVTAIEGLADTLLLCEEDLLQCAC